MFEKVHRLELRPKMGPFDHDLEELIIKKSGLKEGEIKKLWALFSSMQDTGKGGVTMVSEVMATRAFSATLLQVLNQKRERKEPLMVWVCVAY